MGEGKTSRGRPLHSFLIPVFCNPTQGKSGSSRPRLCPPVLQVWGLGVREKDMGNGEQTVSNFKWGSQWLWKSKRGSREGYTGNATTVGP